MPGQARASQKIEAHGERRVWPCSGTSSGTGS